MKGVDEKPQKVKIPSLEQFPENFPVSGIPVSMTPRNQKVTIFKQLDQHIQEHDRNIKSPTFTSKKLDAFAIRRNSQFLSKIRGKNYQFQGMSGAASEKQLIVKQSPCSKKKFKIIYMSQST